MTDWKSTLDEGLGKIGSLGQVAPGTYEGYQQLHAAGRQSDVLGAKVRELICVAVAVTTRSDVCIVNHVAKAQALGATREEVAEALGVAVAMNAGAAIVYAGRALDSFSTFAGESIDAAPGVCG